MNNLSPENKGSALSQLGKTAALLLFPLMAFSASLHAGNGVALSIGLNRVDPAKYNGWSGDLKLCENDADSMEQIAKENGFEPITLKTQEATIAEVKKQILKAAAALVSGDIFVISYSGHGGQVPDQNGDEHPPFDETWCLYDGEIIDDQLALLWKEFKPGVRIVIYSDSCHSGTVLKNFNGTDSSAKFNIREIPDQIQKQVAPQWEEEWKDVPDSDTTMKEISASVLSITACKDEETSIEFLAAKNGLFTENLLEVWNGGKFKGSYEAFHAQIAPKVKAEAATAKHEQSPQRNQTGKDNPDFLQQRPWTR